MINLRFYLRNRDTFVLKHVLSGHHWELVSFAELRSYPNKPWIVWDGLDRFQRDRRPMVATSLPLLASTRTPLVCEMVRRTGLLHFALLFHL